MKTCYYSFFGNNDIGEVFAFYEKVNGKLTLIHWFSANDASYRDEYMGRLFKHFGVRMLRVRSSNEAAALKLLKEALG